MANRKPRAPKPREPIPKHVLDATGAHCPPTMSEILTNGSPNEVREFLGKQGELIRSGAPLPASVAEWLGGALEAIGRGEDANKALRVKKAARGQEPMGVRDRAVIEHQIEDLVQQGLARGDARGVVERFHHQSNILSGKSEEDHVKAADRLKNRLQRKSQGTK